MTTRRFFSRLDLHPFVLDLVGAGMRVIAPVRREERGLEYLEYRRIGNSDEICLDGSQPIRPLKDAIFPQTETLFKWRQAQSLIEIEESPEKFDETVVIGATPCDAAALDIVDRVMGWDYRDEFWFGRRQATTVLTLACTRCDDSCFCTAVGLSPENARGADWFLTAVDGGFEVDVLTPKGETLLERNKARLPAPGSPAGARNSGIGPKVEANLKLWSSLPIK